MSIDHLAALPMLIVTQDGTELHVPAMPGGEAPVSGTTGAPAGPQAQPSGGGFALFMPLILVLILMLVFTSMSGRKQRRQRKELLDGLHRQDRVQTLGGIIGVITELKKDELVLRVDEGSNTRIRFARSAVQTVLRSAKAPKDDAENEEEVEDAPEEAAAV